MKNFSTLSLTLVAIFATLTAIGAFIKVPLPIVPFTLQIIVVFLAGSLLGSKQGLQSQLVYLFVGLAGLPVFTQGGGLMYVLQPTFGYLIGFAAGAFAIGFLIERIQQPSFKHFIAANLIGTVIIYTIGVPYLYLALNFWLGVPTNLSHVLAAGLFSTIGIDIALAIFTSLLAVRLYPVFKTIHSPNKSDLKTKKSVLYGTKLNKKKINLNGFSHYSAISHQFS
ncbi:Biotin ECF transporter S component BioY [Halobacillus karajensis]|uniref:Biotin ECF transporter S component BioY n=1 Tax=Halobacillus karajensis TaxID=195088 RepID=A0A024P7C9_9BACI|nr:biotin transporter BioY [Halobacillus karajensis]CDQ18209.1 Biotin ECF transporter S component BioY [Halobacillus karajensis]CDQ24561.1 Biotin ECF transporter S component BioY [Halobacillus karajensis]CDQ29192.1 Biotin ECF transporter S component BioY [Halobacillus karajensis]